MANPQAHYTLSAAQGKTTLRTNNPAHSIDMPPFIYKETPSFSLHPVEKGKNGER